MIIFMTALCLPRLAVAQGPPPTAVRVNAVQSESLQPRFRVTGDVRAIDRSRIAAEEEGRVLEVLVEEGDRVAAGDVLVRLDDVRLRLEATQLTAEHAAANALKQVRAAELERAQRDVRSLEALATGSAGNPKELDDARSDVLVAEARVLEAAAELSLIDARQALLATRIEDMTILAPFAGTVVTRAAERGGWLDRGDEAVELIADHAFEVWLDVPQRFARALADDEALVWVTIDAAGIEVPGQRPRIVPLVDRQARSFPAYIIVESPDGILKDGMSASGLVPESGRRDLLTVHPDALLQNATGFFVYVAQSAGPESAIARPATVRRLFAAGDRVAVEGGGLTADDLVIVEGNERLFPMMPIMWESTPAPPAGTDP